MDICETCEICDECPICNTHKMTVYVAEKYREHQTMCYVLKLAKRTDRSPSEMIMELLTAYVTIHKHIFK